MKREVVKREVVKREDCKCFDCGNILNDEEYKEWIYCPRCRDGYIDRYMCICYGEPIDPPVCDECFKNILQRSIKDENI